MRHPKNTAMQEKLGAALTKSKPGLTTQAKRDPQLVERETKVRRRFGYRPHSAPETSTAVLEPPAVVEEPQESPSQEEISAALVSVQTSSQPDTPDSHPVEETPSQAPTPLPQIDEGTSLDTPFKPHIVAMLGKLKDARNIVAADLEQTNKRLVKYWDILKAAQADVDSTEMSVLTLTDKIEKIDQNIAECNRLDGMSLEIASLIPQGIHHKLPTSGTVRTRSWNEPHVCRKTDVLSVIEQGPHRNWTAKEIVEALPPIKRANGKINTPSHLSVLASEGKVTRVTQGVYTLACTTTVQ